MNEKVHNESRAAFKFGATVKLTLKNGDTHTGKVDGFQGILIIILQKKYNSNKQEDDVAKKYFNIYNISFFEIFEIAK